MDYATDFGEDRERIRIPLEQDLVGPDRFAVLHPELGAVDHLIAFLLAALLVDDPQDAVAIHRDQIALRVPNGVDLNEFRKAVRLGVLCRLFGDTRSGSANVERTHCEL